MSAPDLHRFVVRVCDYVKNVLLLDRHLRRIDHLNPLDHNRDGREWYQGYKDEAGDHKGISSGRVLDDASLRNFGHVLDKEIDILLDNFHFLFYQNVEVIIQ